VALGASVRAMFGPHERAIASLYRSVYIDLDAYISQIVRWVPHARRILEVGAGEGAVTERLAAAYPEADILAIDVTPRVGRLFSGTHDRVEFRQAPVQDVARERPGDFDLVLLSDVIHHVPLALRDEILAAIRQCIAPGGKLIFKDWAKASTPIHFACWAGDRYLTGDRIAYLTADEAERLVRRHFGTAALSARATVAPWRNNYAFLIDG